MIGAQIGNFSVESAIGKGGFCTVYKALDIRLRRFVAMKFLRNPLDDRHAHYFQREAQTIAKVNKHPHIVEIYEWGEYEGQSYFVLEFCETSIAEQLKMSFNGLSIKNALIFAAQTANALAFAHDNGLIHRDIKPHNILLESPNGPAKLADFGLAQIIERASHSMSVSICGSPPWMSPEQASGNAVDHRSDIFSLGVTLYEMLSGKRPFDSPHPSSIMEDIIQDRRIPLEARMPDVPQCVLKIVNKAIAHMPAERYQHAREMEQDLSVALRELEGIESDTIIIKANPHSDSPAPAKPRRLKLALAGFLSAAAIVISAYTLSNGNLAPRIAEAKELVETNKTDNAIALLNALGNDDPENDEILYLLGYAFLRKGSPEDAKGFFEKIKDTSKSAEGRTAAFLQSGNPDARNVAKEAAMQKASAYTLTLLGEIEMKEGLYKQAKDALERAESAGPFYFNWQEQKNRFLHGQLAYHMKDYDKAREIFHTLGDATSTSENRRMIDSYVGKLDSEKKREEDKYVLDLAAKNKQLRSENASEDSSTIQDKWRSRPLTFHLLPLAGSWEDGETDAGMLEISLTERIRELSGMAYVDRSQLELSLRERYLKLSLSNDEARQQLEGFVTPDLLIDLTIGPIAGKRNLGVSAIWTDTTKVAKRQLIECEKYDIFQVIENASQAVVNAVKEKPLQGTLTVNDGVAVLDIGSAVGVKEGMNFDISTGSKDFIAQSFSATVEKVTGDWNSTVRLNGVEPSEIRGLNWYVRQSISSQDEARSKAS